MTIFNKYGRKIVTIPVTALSAVLWVGMFSSWIGPRAESKEKPLKQALVKIEEPNTKPEPSKEEAKPEARPEANPSREQTMAQAKQPVQGAPAAGERPPAGGAVTLQAGRQELEKQGAAFMAAGKGLDDLPPVAGGAASVAAYIHFSRRAGYHFAAYSAEKKAYLGEIRFGERAVIAPLNLPGGYSLKGRIVEHETLVRLARSAAGNENITLYALCPDAWTSYMTGKIIEAIKICGINDRKEIAAFEAEFVVRGARAVAVFKKAILNNGSSIAINDSEG